MATKMARYFAHKNIISEDKQDVYSFGLEILLATIINGVLVAAVSVWMGVFWQSVLMLIPFILMRSNAGGYHADSHFGCMLKFMATYTSCLLIAKYMPPETIQPAAYAGLVISAVVILIIGPLPHRNRPVSVRELAAYKVKSRILSACFMIVGLTGTYFFSDLFLYFALGMCIAAGSLLAGCINEKRKGGKQNEQV
jgi:accessory gene regulator B